MIEPDTWEYHFYDHDKDDPDCFMCQTGMGYPIKCDECGGLIHRQVVGIAAYDYPTSYFVIFRCDLCGKEWEE